MREQLDSRLFLAALAVLLAVGGYLACSGEAAPPTQRSALGQVGVVHAAGAASGEAEAAPVGNQRQSVDSGASRVVRVVDAISGQAIVGATVRHGACASQAIQWGTAITGAEGQVLCPDGCEGLVLAVTADHHAPALEYWNASETSPTVRLDRAAVLRLRFVDAAGEPVAGVGTRLLAPLKGGPDWGNDWRQGTAVTAWAETLIGAKAGDMATQIARGVALADGRVLPAVADCLREVLTTPSLSDAEGVVEYGKLPAGERWRWGRASSHMIGIVPLHESSPLLTDERGVRASATRRVDDLSGSIALVAGETRELTIRVFGRGSVRGRFPALAAALRPQVKLFHMTATEPGSKVRAVECSMEAFTTADDDGSFRFEGVRPGPKVVRAYWRTSAIDYVFATAVGVLADHEDLDMGVVQPFGGEITVRVDLLDRAQQVVPLASVLGDAEPSALLNISTWNTPGAMAESVHEIVSVPLSTDVRLHGLTFGKIRLRSACGPDWQAPPQALRLLDSPGVEVKAPPTGVVLVPLALEERVARELTISAPAAMRPPLELWLRPTRGGDPERFRVPGGSGDATMSLAVLPEPYEVLALSVAAADETALVGDAVLDFTMATRGLLPLSAGAMVRGRCRSATGAPLADRRLLWTRAGWRRGTHTLWLFRAETDAEGRFVVAGLPPGSELRGSRPGTGFVVPNAGDIAEVDLLLEN